MIDRLHVEPYKFAFKKCLPVGYHITSPRRVLFGHDMDSTRYAYYKNDPITGVIVGGTYKQLGTVKKGYSYADEYDPSFLVVSSTLFLYKVISGFTNAPVFVHPEDVVPVVGAEVPFRFTGWDERGKKNASEQSKSWPRDKKGRFIK